MIQPYNQFYSVMSLIFMYFTWLIFEDSIACGLYLGEKTNTDDTGVETQTNVVKNSFLDDNKTETDKILKFKWTNKKNKKT